MDITAGLSKLRTQINKLEKRIHNLDMESVNASELHAAIQSLNALKDRYKEMEELHAKKKKEKQEKESKNIPMDKTELVKEHEHLVDVLKSPSHADDAQEAVKQEKELQEYKEATPELCKGDDHQPNPGQLLPGGGKCVECGGFIPDATKQAAPEQPKPTTVTHPSFQPNNEDRPSFYFPRRPTRKMPKHRIVDVPAPKPTKAPQEKKSDTNKFAIHDVVEPSRGTPGSKGRVMGHDEINDMVYVAWTDGTLKESHGYGAYSAKDLKKHASQKKASLERTSLWKDKLQSVYSDFEEFKAYDDTYGLSQRLGFASSEEAWEANPMVQGSTNPADYKVVGNLIKKAGPGAGREFKVKKNDISAGSFIYNLETGNITWKEMPGILAFDLFGYYDGIEDADGRLVKIKDISPGWWQNGQANIKHDLAAAMKDWQKESPIVFRDSTGDIEVGIDLYGLESMIGGGYMRTVLKPGDTFQACGDGYLSTNYEMYETSFCATIECQKEFDYLEQDVFDMDTPEKDDEGNDVDPSDYAEMMREPYRYVRPRAKSSLDTDVTKEAASNNAVIDAFVNRTNSNAKSSNLYIRDRGDSWDLINYQTVIAKHMGDKILMDNRRYSVTTTKLQGQIGFQASQAGIPLHDMQTGKPMDHNQEREDAYYDKLPSNPMYQHVGEKRAEEEDFDESEEGMHGEAFEPSEDDIFIQSEGPLGSQTAAYHNGKEIARLDHKKANDWEDFYMQIAQWMSDNNYSPNVWTISDHGNLELVTDMPQAKASSLETDGNPDAQDVVDTYINGNISDAREWLKTNPDLFPEAYELMQQFAPQDAKRFMQLVYPRMQYASLNKKATSWHVLGNGDLEITLDPQMAQDVNPETLDSDNAMYDLFEPVIANGLSWVAPEDIGALTDAPILSDSPSLDDGSADPKANYWWFPNYMVESPARTLVETGRVIFKKASKDSVNKKADHNKIPLNVFDGGFTAVETSGQTPEAPHGYAIFDPKGEQVMVITTKAPISVDRLESIVHDEYGKKQLVRATLKEDHETLKTGSKFIVSGIDRVTKEVRLKAEKENVWVPISKVAVSAETLEQQINDMKTRMTQTQERLQQSVTTQATVDATAGTFQVGDRVTDARKGEGTVTYVSHDQITVDWDWIGQKLLGPEPIPMAKTKGIKKITKQPEVQAQVDKVADEPMPTTPAPQGMRWAFDADVRKWILVKKQGL